MTRILRKQDRNDFISRIERLDPAFAATPAKARDERKPWELGTSSGKPSESPVLMSGLGFGLAIAAIFAANDPDTVQAFLLNLGWPAQFLNYAMYVVSILIIGLVVFYLVNVIRIMNPRATGRWNAGGLVAGAVAAIGFSAIDETYINAGLQYVGFESPSDLITLAQNQTARITSIDWTSVVMVSSSPK